MVWSPLNKIMQRLSCVSSVNSIGSQFIEAVSLFPVGRQRACVIGEIALPLLNIFYVHKELVVLGFSI